jgi:hypothetical protein
MYGKGKFNTLGLFAFHCNLASFRVTRARSLEETVATRTAVAAAAEPVMNAVFAHSSRFRAALVAWFGSRSSCDGEC